MKDGDKLWLWKNGPGEFWAFDNLHPCYPDGDPMTLGEPVGYAVFKRSVDGRQSWLVSKSLDVPDTPPLK
jgi:hypothetical protein